jgi:predicted oxidoreductase
VTGWSPLVLTAQGKRLPIPVTSGYESLSSAVSGMSDYNEEEQSASILKNVKVARKAGQNCTSHRLAKLKTQHIAELFTALKRAQSPNKTVMEVFGLFVSGHLIYVTRLAVEPVGGEHLTEGYLNCLLCSNDLEIVSSSMCSEMKYKFVFRRSPLPINFFAETNLTALVKYLRFLFTQRAKECILG